MRALIIAASNRQPDWVEHGYREYARRLHSGLTLELKLIPLARRGPSVPVARAVALEGERMLAAVPQGAHVVTLSESGSAWSTTELAAKLDQWITAASPVALLIGGPDGLSPDCSARARESWSLSPLTLPHGLARILVAEALYRALSLRSGHPYHRA